MRDFTRRCVGAAVVMAVWALLCVGTSAWAQEGESDQAKNLVDALIHGTPTLNVRGRIELAKAEGLERSEAYTVRTELGYGTKPWYGLRVYTSFENVATATQKTYWVPTEGPNTEGQTVIADPPGTEVQQGYLEYKNAKLLDSMTRGGRQEIIYDDWRFIGNVVWRQNQQTFDAVTAVSKLGLDDLKFQYGWIGNVNRIFGGGGANPNLSDFRSNSHVLNANYKVAQQLDVTAFAYLLDLKTNAPAPADDSANSNQSYGFIAKGKIPTGDSVTFDYFFSYAFQKNYADKAIDYKANYIHGAAGIKLKGLGRLGAGYELLGSDDGRQQFLTPLATAHKFNGWVDVYLNNGGPAGLRDLYVNLAPAMPWKLKPKIIYHRFWDDNTNTHRGDEIDAEVRRHFGKHLMLLAKGGYFISATDAFPEVDTWRFWFDVVIKF